MKPKSLSDQLRVSIESADISRYRLSKMTGVSQGQLYGFVKGTRRLSLKSLELIAEALDLQVVVQAKKRRKK